MANSVVVVVILCDCVFIRCVLFCEVNFRNIKYKQIEINRTFWYDSFIGFGDESYGMCCTFG